MRRAFLLLLATLALSLVLVPRPTSASLGWWDASWTKRRQIFLPPHPENAQILLTLPFADNSIRFLEDEDGGLLPYWVENCGENWMRVWVRRTENADNTIYVYYGNPSAGRADNGFDVFPFFDDFDTDNYIDWGRWGAGGPVSATVSGGVMTVSGTQSDLQYVYGRTYLKYCTMRARLRAHSNANYMQAGLSDLPDQPGGLDAASLTYDAGWRWRTARNDASWFLAISVDMTQWRTMQIDWSASQVTFRLDENVHTITANVPQDDMSVWFYVYSSPSGATRAWQVDWVFVARHVVEGTVGDEEEAPVPLHLFPSDLEVFSGNAFTQRFVENENVVWDWEDNWDSTRVPSINHLVFTSVRTFDPDNAYTLSDVRVRVYDGDTELHDTGWLMPIINLNMFINDPENYCWVGESWRENGKVKERIYVMVYLSQPLTPGRTYGWKVSYHMRPYDDLENYVVVENSSTFRVATVHLVEYKFLDLWKRTVRHADRKLDNPDWENITTHKVLIFGRLRYEYPVYPYPSPFRSEPAAPVFSIENLNGTWRRENVLNYFDLPVHLNMPACGVLWTDPENAIFLMSFDPSDDHPIGWAHQRVWLTTNFAWDADIYVTPENGIFITDDNTQISIENETGHFLRVVYTFRWLGVEERTRVYGVRHIDSALGQVSVNWVPDGTAYALYRVDNSGSFTSYTLSDNVYFDNARIDGVHMREYPFPNFPPYLVSWSADPFYVDRDKDVPDSPAVTVSRISLSVSDPDGDAVSVRVDIVENESLVRTFWSPVFDYDPTDTVPTGPKSARIVMADNYGTTTENTVSELVYVSDMGRIGPLSFDPYPPVYLWDVVVRDKLYVSGIQGYVWSGTVRITDKGRRFTSNTFENIGGTPYFRVQYQVLGKPGETVNIRLEYWTENFDGADDYLYYTVYENYRYRVWLYWENDAANPLVENSWLGNENFLFKILWIGENGTEYWEPSTNPAIYETPNEPNVAVRLVVDKQLCPDTGTLYAYTRSYLAENCDIRIYVVEPSKLPYLRVYRIQLEDPMRRWGFNVDGKVGFFKLENGRRVFVDFERWSIVNDVQVFLLVNRPYYIHLVAEGRRLDYGLFVPQATESIIVNPEIVKKIWENENYIPLLVWTIRISLEWDADNRLRMEYQDNTFQTRSITITVRNLHTGESVVFADHGTSIYSCVYVGSPRHDYRISFMIEHDLYGTLTFEKMSLGALVLLPPLPIPSVPGLGFPVPLVTLSLIFGVAFVLLGFGQIHIPAGLTFLTLMLWMVRMTTGLVPSGICGLMTLITILSWVFHHRRE